MPKKPNETMTKRFAPNRLREHRLAAKLTLEELADLVDSNYQTVQKIENRDRKFSFDWALKFSKALGKAPGDFFYTEGAAAAGMDDLRYTGSGIPRKIPVWGVVDAHDGEKYAINTEDTPLDFIDPLPQQQLDKDAYGLLVSGNSMTPALKPGCIACVHTRRPVVAGDICVIEFKDGGGWVKEYIRKTDGHIVVKQYNPEKELKLAFSDIKKIIPVIGVIFRS